MADPHFLDAWRMKSVKPESTKLQVRLDVPGAFTYAPDQRSTHNITKRLFRVPKLPEPRESLYDFERDIAAHEGREYIPKSYFVLGGDEEMTSAQKLAQEVRSRAQNEESKVPASKSETDAKDESSNTFDKNQDSITQDASQKETSAPEPKNEQDVVDDEDDFEDAVDDTAKDSSSTPTKGAKNSTASTANTRGTKASKKDQRHAGKAEAKDSKTTSEVDASKKAQSATGKAASSDTSKSTADVKGEDAKKDSNDHATETDDAQKGSSPTNDTNEAKAKNDKASTKENSPSASKEASGKGADAANKGKKKASGKNNKAAKSKPGDATSSNEKDSNAAKESTGATSSDDKGAKASKDAKETSKDKDSKAGVDSEECKDVTTAKESEETKDGNAKESKETASLQDAKETKLTTSKDGKKSTPSKKGTGSQDTKESTESKSTKDSKGTKESTESKSARDSKETKDDPKPVKGMDSKISKNGTESKDGKVAKESTKDVKNDIDSKNVKDNNKSEDAKDGKVSNDLKEKNESSTLKEEKNRRDTKESAASTKATDAKELKKAEDAPKKKAVLSQAAKPDTSKSADVVSKSDEAKGETKATTSSQAKSQAPEPKEAKKATQEGAHDKPAKSAKEENAKVPSSSPSTVKGKESEGTSVSEDRQTKAATAVKDEKNGAHLDDEVKPDVHRGPMEATASAPRPKSIASSNSSVMSSVTRLSAFAPSVSGLSVLAENVRPGKGDGLPAVVRKNLYNTEYKPAPSVSNMSYTKKPWDNKTWSSNRTFEMLTRQPKERDAGTQWDAISGQGASSVDTKSLNYHNVTSDVIAELFVPDPRPWHPYRLVRRTNPRQVLLMCAGTALSPQQMQSLQLAHKVATGQMGPIKDAKSLASYYGTTENTDLQAGVGVVFNPSVSLGEALQEEVDTSRVEPNFSRRLERPTFPATTTSVRAALRSVVAALEYVRWEEEGFDKIVIATHHGWIVRGIANEYVQATLTAASGNGARMDGVSHAKDPKVYRKSLCRIVIYGSCWTTRYDSTRRLSMYSLH